jgi:hypothetical protein
MDLMSDTTQPGSSADQDLRPGDEAPPGTEGTGENLCRECGGSGREASGSACRACAGTGRVVEAIGGA